MVGDYIVGNSNFKAFKFFVIGYKLVFLGSKWLSLKGFFTTD